MTQQNPTITAWQIYQPLRFFIRRFSRWAFFD